MQERNSQEHGHTGDEKEVQIIMDMTSKRWSLKKKKTAGAWSYAILEAHGLLSWWCRHPMKTPHHLVATFPSVGHVEAAFLQLPVLLAECTRATPEVDAAVQARGFLQVVLCAH